MHPQIQQYINAVAQANGTANTAVMFNVQPSVSQRMREAVRLSSAFLTRINSVTRKELVGETIGITARLNASRTNTNNGDGSVARKPQNVHSKNARRYELKKVNFDTYISYDDMDTWAQNPEYISLVNSQIVKSKALSLIAIGFNGKSAADNSDFTTNPLLQDVQKGWLQHIREENPTNVMGSTSSPVTVGTSGTYKNLDALVMDAVAELIDEEFADTPDMVVICGRGLLSDKYFQVINAAGDKATEQLAADMVTAQKRIGGLQAITVPYFPKNTILITPLSNLSIYYQASGHRRKLEDQPEYDRISDFQSENIGYVVEELGAAALIENIVIS